MQNPLNSLPIKANVAGVHEASSLIAKLIFAIRLRELPAGSSVLLSAGGGASGKTYAINKVLIHNAALIYDSVMKSAQGNKELIEQVVIAGHSPHVVAVFMPIEMAATQNTRRSAKHRRLVPLKVLGGGHIGFRETFEKHTIPYLKEKGVKYSLLENDGINPPQSVSVEKFIELIYNDAGEILERARKSSFQEYEQNPTGKQFDPRIPAALEGQLLPQYDTRTTGEIRSEPRSDGSGNDPGDRGRKPKTQSDGAEGNLDAGQIQDAEQSSEGSDNQLGAPPGSAAGNSNSARDLGSGQPGRTRRNGGKRRTNAVSEESVGESGSGTGLESGVGEQPSGDVRDSANDGNPVAPSLSNFQITDELDFGKFSPKQNYRNNVAAIKLLQILTDENRRATASEQSILAKYIGWGGLAPAFDKGNQQWSKEFTELRELLTEDEYERARASTRNAHYTSKTVVKGIWDAVQRFGFKTGHVLEPSMGTGNFLGLMPSELNRATGITGVELDTLTANIAKHLYPKSTIFSATGFQEVYLPEGTVDLAVGNPPFGAESVRDRDNNVYGRIWACCKKSFTSLPVLVSTPLTFPKIPPTFFTPILF